MNVTLIVGPPDSGKSTMAEQRVLACAGVRPLYVGTLPLVTAARPRIARHKVRRGHAWELVEVRRDLAEAAEWLRARGPRPTLIDGVSEYIARSMHGQLAVSGFVHEANTTAHTIGRLEEIAAHCSELFLVTSRRPARYGPPNAFDRIHDAMVRQIASICREVIELGGDVGQNHLG